MRGECSMFKEHAENLYHVECKHLWNFLLNYSWCNLLKGYSVKEEQNKWYVQLENKANSNIQIVEMTFDENINTIHVKITPKFNKYQSYDLLTISLINKKNSSTLVEMNYGFHSKLFTEKIFARILNHEDKIFEEYSKNLFDDVNKYLLDKLYG